MYTHKAEALVSPETSTQKDILSPTNVLFSQQDIEATGRPYELTTASERPFGLGICHIPTTLCQPCHPCAQYPMAA